jgi:hypothetical protein
VGRVLVLLPVPREERYPASSDLAEGDGTGRRAVRRLDGPFLDVLEQRVEPGAAEDPDLGLGQAVSFAPVEEELEDLEASFFFPSFFPSPDEDVSALGLGRESVA